jgi:hypothetical protein
MESPTLTAVLLGLFALLALVITATGYRRCDRLLGSTIRTQEFGFAWR